MICLHCGWCCFMYDVIIIAPEYATPNFKFKELSEDMALHKNSDKACPHIEVKDNLYFCKIHNYKWYKRTPCFQHGQIESNENCNCRMGEYILNNPKMKNHILQILKEKDKHDAIND